MGKERKGVSGGREGNQAHVLPWSQGQVGSGSPQARRCGRPEPVLGAQWAGRVHPSAGRAGPTVFQAALR